MTEVTAIVKQASALLIHYDFDILTESAEELVATWVSYYPPYWLRLAIVEALYQGRYKGVSVEHLLNFWQRRGHPFYHFSHEFERLICQDFPLEESESVNVEVIAQKIEKEKKYLSPWFDDSPFLPVVSVEGDESVIDESLPEILTVKPRDFYAKLKSISENNLPQTEEIFQQEELPPL